MSGNKTQWFLAVWSLLVIFGCTESTGKTDPTPFQHDVSGQVQPWTSEDFDAAGDKFTFAVFSDLTGGERPGIFTTAVAQLNLLRPEFILNVGDLIEGNTTDLNEIDVQWKSFDERANRAIAPVFYVGGNHDLTGKVLQDVWDERLGRRYYHFVYKNVLFLILDTEDNTPERTREIFEIRNVGVETFMNEGEEAYLKTEYATLPERNSGNLTSEQSDYFAQVIAANPDVRWTFLFMHKAPWERAEETNFGVIEEALTDRPYTVFHGHMHAYEYLERLGRDYIRLATTGGSQYPESGLSEDHVTLVTVDGNNVDIANLLMSGILDRTGRVPLPGNDGSD